MKIDILIVEDGGVFVELLGRLSLAHYALRYAEDLSAARRLQDERRPRLLIVASEQLEHLEPLMTEARAAGVLILCLYSDAAPAPTELVDAVVPRQDIDHVIRIVGLLLEERRRFPRAAVELPITLVDSGEAATATMISPQSLFVPRERPPADGTKVGLSIARSEGDVRCTATVIRAGRGESGQAGMVLAIPEDAPQVRALLDNLVRRTLMAGHLQDAQEPAALPAELTREVTRRVEELSGETPIGLHEAEPTAGAPEPREPREPHEEPDPLRPDDASAFAAPAARSLAASLAAEPPRQQEPAGAAAEDAALALREIELALLELRGGFEGLSQEVEKRLIQYATVQQEDHQALRLTLVALEEQLATEGATRAMHREEGREALEAIAGALEQQLAQVDQRVAMQHAEHQALQQVVQALQQAVQVLGEQLVGETTTNAKRQKEGRASLEAVTAGLREQLERVAQRASEQERSHDALEQQLAALQQQLAAESATRAQQLQQSGDELAASTRAFEQRVVQQATTEQQQRDALRLQLAEQQRQLESLVLRATNQEEDLQASQQRWQSLEEHAEKEYQASSEQRVRLDEATAELQRRLTSLDVLLTGTARTANEVEKRLDEVSDRQAADVAAAEQDRRRIAELLDARASRLDTLSHELEQRLDAIVQRQEAAASAADETRERVDGLLDAYGSRLDRLTEGLARFATMHTDALRQLEAQIAELERDGRVSSRRRPGAGPAGTAPDEAARGQQQRLGGLEQQVAALRTELTALRSKLAPRPVEPTEPEPQPEQERDRGEEATAAPRRRPYLAAAVALLVLGALGTPLALRFFGEQREELIVEEDGLPPSADAREDAEGADAQQHDAAAAALWPAPDATPAATDAAADRAAPTPAPLSPEARRLRGRHLRWAKQLTRQGKHKGARRALMQALKLRDDQRVRMLLVNSCLSAGDLSSAILHLEKAIEGSGAPDLYDQLGLLRLKQKRKALACEAFRAALARDAAHRAAATHLKRHCR